MRTRLLVLFILASPASAQDTSIPWAREVINSSTLNEQRSIYVVTPAGYRTGTGHYPVLVVLDANEKTRFNLDLATVAFLASQKAIPELIVVGIPNGRDRTHDLTPQSTGQDAKQFPTAGGAERFADFIIDEVVPLIRSKYRTLPGTILAGHSFGGLLALETAAKKPGAFTAVIAMSPSLWWNEGGLVAGYSDAIAKAGKPQRLFVTSGGLEADVDHFTQLFSRRLDSLRPLFTTFAYRRYPEDTHFLTPGPSLVDGLRFAFEQISVDKLPIAALVPTSDAASVVRALSESRRRYAAGARSYGLDERVPESEFNNLGYAVLAALSDPALAVWVFQQNLDLHPESASAYASLGDGLLVKGDTTAAMAMFRRAMDVGIDTNPVLQETRRKLKLLEVRRAAKPKRPTKARKTNGGRVRVTLAPAK
jgi:predicted alpha/beta superfamily hydrolase